MIIRIFSGRQKVRLQKKVSRVHTGNCLQELNKINKTSILVNWFRSTEFNMPPLAYKKEIWLNIRNKKSLHAAPYSHYTTRQHYQYSGLPNLAMLSTLVQGLTKGMFQILNLFCRDSFFITDTREYGNSEV